MNFLRTISRYFDVFRRYVGSRLYILVALPIVASLLEGIGISLFLPVLSVTEHANKPSRMGDFIRSFFSWLGLDPSLKNALAVLCVAFIAKSVVDYFQSRADASIVSDVTLEVRRRWLQGLGSIDYQAFLTSSVGKLSHSISFEVIKLSNGLQAFTLLLAFLCTTVVLLAGSMYLSFDYTVFGAALGFGVAFSQRAISRRAKRLSMESVKKTGQFHADVIQGLSAYKYLTAVGKFEVLSRRIGLVLDDVTFIAKKLALTVPLHQVLSQPVLILAFCGLIVWKHEYQGESISVIFTSLLLFYRVTANILSLQGAWTRFMGLTGSIDSVTEVLSWMDAHRRPEFADYQSSPKFEKEIAFEKVNFSHGEKKVLSDVSFKIRKNSTVAFVGESGGGKTTIIDILVGLLSPDSGRVSVDNVVIGQEGRKGWSRQIGYVNQDSVLFNDSVLNNVSLWQEDGSYVPSDQARRAVSLSNSSDFIEELANGWAYAVGDRGSALSGGQKQRIAIARELYRQPALLVLDEATSALDSKSEEQVQLAIEGLRGLTTIIIIAHRLSTVRKADWIFVVDKGHIVESGEYSTLMNQNGSVFGAMLRKQGILGELR